MKIDDVSVRLQHERNLSRIKASKSDAQAETFQGLGSVKDTAQTSALARLASEAVRQLQEEPIREEKVSQFKFLADDDSKFSDGAIDAIFERMFAM